MGNNIFDWDNEDDEKAEDRQTAFQPPVAAVDYWDDIQPKDAGWDDPWQEPQGEREPVEYIPYEPQTPDETARRGGLAWSAGIVFFSAIVFMLFIGWGADKLLGSSPWGIVAGIVLGSIIGFIQFFRISSQILDSEKSGSAVRPIIRLDDDDR